MCPAYRKCSAKSTLHTIQLCRYALPKRLLGRNLPVCLLKEQYKIKCVMANVPFLWPSHWQYRYFSFKEQQRVSTLSSIVMLQAHLKSILASIADQTKNELL